MRQAQVLSVFHDHFNVMAITIALIARTKSVVVRRDRVSAWPFSIAVLVLVKPTVVAAPQRQIEVNAGQTLTIQCTARGSPAPYINWRLNWGHVCGDGVDSGRCQMTQALDPADPGLVTGTLTVRNVNAADGGAYSCEALNNQGFIFAIPDAIVNVIIGSYSSIENRLSFSLFRFRGSRCPTAPTGMSLQRSFILLLA